MTKDNKGEVRVTTKIQKWGNSLAVRIPSNIADEIKITQGSDVELRIENQELKIVPAKKKPTLEELMAKITPENRHGEIDWGKPEGDELW
ncbi:AbrB/MazE/SpoVT family DNA-binding domain-containing protein [Virgibacillus sp. C22-A2]|uniref:AbrB/MazE/SpoVT family DNA-binding domain-containing protein n=2 Tax=Virgibacillus tibetensis TaxID=3042313 RepID=A0ABU6KKN0_9BACI|nr:AbrB/MazE/SpoVT family DNA-binding domain-containing protein [Virgibacillus sp. C22-A2]